MTALSRFKLVALGIPVTTTVLAVGVQLALLPRVPTQVAVHWNGAGNPDNFGPAWSYPLLTIAVSLVLPLLLAWPSLKQLTAGIGSGIYRFLGAMCAGLSLMFAILMTWALAMQVGITDPRTAPSIVLPLFVSLGIGLLVGLLGWLALPAPSPSRNQLPPCRCSFVAESK